MAQRQRGRSNGPRPTYTAFVGMPRLVLDSKAFIDLPIPARCLYLDLRRQYNGRNNGDICAADGVLHRYGWSHSSIHKNLKILKERGFIAVARQGGIGAMSKTPTLYRFTDVATNANPDKLIDGGPPTLEFQRYVPGLDRARRQRGSPGPGVAAETCVPATLVRL
jgi:hypothetical protein